MRGLGGLCSDLAPSAGGFGTLHSRQTPGNVCVRVCVRVYTGKEGGREGWRECSSPVSVGLASGATGSQHMMVADAAGKALCARLSFSNFFVGKQGWATARTAAGTRLPARSQQGPHELRRTGPIQAWAYASRQELVEYGVTSTRGPQNHCLAAALIAYPCLSPYALQTACLHTLHHNHDLTSTCTWHTPCPAGM